VLLGINWGTTRELDKYIGNIIGNYWKPCGNIMGTWSMNTHPKISKPPMNNTPLPPPFSIGVILGDTFLPCRNHMGAKQMWHIHMNYVNQLFSNILAKFTPTFQM
jgi:hypothetical protein